jgi:hypothetical protein
MRLYLNRLLGALLDNLVPFRSSQRIVHRRLEPRVTVQVRDVTALHHQWWRGRQPGSKRAVFTPSTGIAFSGFPLYFRLPAAGTGVDHEVL